MAPPSLAKIAQKGGFHAISGNETLAGLRVDQDLGLSDAEAARRRQVFGFNVLEKAKTRTVGQILVSQFKSLIVFLLVSAAALSFSFGQTAEGLAILAVIVINAAIGFITELKGVRSMEALRSLTHVEARVRRGGEVKEISAEELVPGDIVIVEAGDVAGADLRLLEASRLRIDESILTGESLPVTKKTRVMGQKTLLPERSNMAFQGTGVMLGAGEGVVTATGLSTELGKIAHLAETAEDTKSPLEKRITYLGHQLVWMTLILALMVGGVGLFSDIPFYLIALTAIALAVAAVPEGLPMVATLALARGMWRMAKKNALIERLSAVETLGSTTVIMVDKTGTMTENRMTATWLALPGSDVQVLPKKGGQGAIFKRDGTHLNLNKNKELWPLLRTSVLCNTAYLEEAAASTHHYGTHHYEGVGDPTEVALLVLGAQAGFFHHKLIEKYPEIHIEAFDPELKMMASLHRMDGKVLTAVKGAPEEVVKYCTKIAGPSGKMAMTEALRKDWRANSAKLAAKGLRVLAIAEKVTQQQGKETYEGLTFLGLVGLHDPPRQDVPGAIKACRRAGMQVIMVTGDHAITAREISRAIGLAAKKDAVIEGGQWEDLGKISEKERAEILSASVFARVSPKQKLELIGLYQDHGHIVAMTGDGVNDAPALRKADIGIAMGKRGSQVAREAADIILRDDAFSTIVAAIAQGRVIFGNIRNFIVYLLSCNLSEILVVGLAFLSGLPLPLLPLQILFLNLVTDIFPAFALGVGEGEKGVMKIPPRDPKEPILPKFLWGGIIGLGGIMTAAVLGAFTFAIWGLGMDASKAVTVSFLTLGFAQLWHVFNMRKADSGFFLNEISSNPFVWGALALCSGLLFAAQFLPWLAGLLGLSPIGWAAWGTVLICSLAPLAVVQVLKWLRIVS